MLRSFYPIVSPAELVRAWRERPQYFAGAVIIGTSGDKIRLPDGRIFDLIYAVDGNPADRRWQVIEPGPAEDGGRFPLEPGPLLFVDPDQLGTPVAGVVFESLVAGRLAQLGGVDAAIGVHEQTIVSASSSEGFAASYWDTVRWAEGNLAGHVSSQASMDLAGVVQQSGAMGEAIVSTESSYDNPPESPDMPDLPRGRARPEDIPPTGTAVPRD